MPCTPCWNIVVRATGTTFWNFLKRLMQTSSLMRKDNFFGSPVLLLLSSLLPVAVHYRLENEKPNKWGASAKKAAVNDVPKSNVTISRRMEWIATDGSEFDEERWGGTGICVCSLIGMCTVQYFGVVRLLFILVFTAGQFYVTAYLFGRL